MARAPGLYRRGRVWWAKYYVNGRRVRESTGTEKETEAKRFLDGRRGRVATGQPIMPRADRVRYDVLAADLRAYYQTTGTRDLEEAGGRLKHLDAFFVGMRVVSITPDAITRYVHQRQQATPGPDDTVIPGAANGTINRELGVLSRMLTLGYKHGKVLRLPVIEKLTEAAPRSGFFEDLQYHAVRRRLAEDLQLAAAIAHTFRMANPGDHGPRVVSRRPRRRDAAPGARRDEERGGAPRRRPARGYAEAHGHIPGHSGGGCG